jgi:hypothetical protein
MKAGEGFTKSMTLLNMLAENPMNTGTASDIITGAQKLAKFVGRDVDPRSINSETYQALVVEAVGQIITAFGSGTGVSNIDLAFSKQAAAMLQRNPGSAQAILAEAVRRYGARVNNYNRRVESGRSLASDAGLNPKIFDNLIVDIGKVKISPKLDVKGPPEEWPDTWEILQQGGLGGVNNPPGTPQVNPPPRPWGRP